MSAPSLRPARSTDAGTVGAILSEFIDTTPWMPRIHTRAEDLGFAGQMIANGWVTVAEGRDAVTGFIAQADTDIHALYVAGDARGAGTGSALLAAAKAQVSRLTLWTFQTNARAQAFYLRHGFVAMERTDGARNDERLPDIRFEWTRKGA